jgi:RNA polymerase sigma factor (sigma-70 family)
MDQARASRCQDVASGDRVALVLAAQVDPGRREDLIEEFRPLIATVARPYCRHGSIERNELIQQGVVGLLEALKRYDPSLGTPFWSYASWWVRQAMQQVTSELDGPIVLSDRARRSLSRLAAARRVYLQEQRREPTRSELAAAAAVDVGHVESLLGPTVRPGRSRSGSVTAPMASASVTCSPTRGRRTSSSGSHAAPKPRACRPCSRCSATASAWSCRDASGSTEKHARCVTSRAISA